MRLNAWNRPFGVGWRSARTCTCAARRASRYATPTGTARGGSGRRPRAVGPPPPPSARRRHLHRIPPRHIILLSLRPTGSAGHAGTVAAGGAGGAWPPPSPPPPLPRRVALASPPVGAVGPHVPLSVGGGGGTGKSRQTTAAAPPPRCGGHRHCQLPAVCGTPVYSLGSGGGKRAGCLAGMGWVGGGGRGGK
ncbi:hypothetical protein BU14_0070s0012 [Porphyra umbilicalis]|uniref:Uncharacterized protein n=1 Tax=Porphyra umbilicalis TaxID=2786 RepID=A0A1X6PG53_PORUM|nr:hypothetical protein BU14_0070s0012 [Porphyra umbilicalis]|eukprot:OSX79837.1 hypothetical protein BU14_0070s0012 [Porphyra umbilicalis]